MANILKEHKICYVLACNGPMTRTEIMAHVHLLDGHTPETFKPRSNNCYFSPTDGPNGRDNSVISRGLVKAIAKGANGELLYDLTNKGCTKACDYMWLAVPVIAQKLKKFKMFAIA